VLAYVCFILTLDRVIYAFSFVYLPYHNHNLHLLITLFYQPTLILLFLSKHKMFV
jgi:hypothetical protein